MPLYEYKCENCGDIFEVMQKFTDEPVTTHVKCGGKVDRLISASSLQFKGSGFYITDYGKSKSGSTPENGSSAKGESTGGKGSSSSESAPGASTASGSSTESKTSSSDAKSSSSGSKQGSSESK